jgi:hypothetical protein
VPHGYCTECDARVTVIDGACLLGHIIDPATISKKRGRRIAAMDGTGSSGAVALLERTPSSHESTTEALSATQKPALPPADIRAAAHRSAAPPTTPPRTARPVVQQASASRPPQQLSDADLNPTGEYVLNLWDGSENAAPIEDWAPENPLVSMPERNPVGWLSILLVLLAAGAVIAAIALVMGNGDSDAEALSADAAALRSAMSEFDIAQSTPSFAEPDMAARAVLVSAERLDVGDPQRAVAIDAATRLLESQRTLSEALSYETGFFVFVGRPSLPTEAAESELSDVSAQFTSWVSDLNSVLLSAPDDRAFSAHREAVARFDVEIRDLQARYLDALRAGDADEATQMLDESDLLVGELEATLNAAVTGSRLSFTTNAEQIDEMLIRLVVEP